MKDECLPPGGIGSLRIRAGQPHWSDGPPTPRRHAAGATNSQMTLLTIGASRPLRRGSKNWWKVTANRDGSVSIARLEEDWEKAKLKGQARSPAGPRISLTVIGVRGARRFDDHRLPV